MIQKIITNIFIYFISFKVVQYFKRGELSFLNGDTLSYLSLQFTILFSSFISGKFSTKKHEEFIPKVKPYLISFVLSIGLITLYFNLFSQSIPSRTILSGTIFLGFVIELVYMMIGNSLEKGKRIKFDFIISPIIFMIDLILLISLLLYTYVFQHNPQISFSSDKVSISILILLWLFSGLATHHFAAITSQIKIWDFLWKHVKGNILFLALVSFSVFILSPEGMSSIYPIFISIIYLLTSPIIISFYYYEKTPQKSDEVVTKYLKATEISEEPILAKVAFDTQKYKMKNSLFSHYLMEQLGEIYLCKYPGIFDFIDSVIDLYSIDSRRSIILRSSDLYNIEVLPANMIEFYMNLHEVNDMRRINEYFIKINTKLIAGGLFIGCVEPSSLRKLKFTRNYPFYLAHIFYFFDFIWRRVFPKLPYFKNIYFVLSRGRNRVISLSEILGRMSYCGFETIKMKQIEEKVYFIVKKVNEPLTDKNPSYGPFIKLKRIGKDGKMISVYKFRTMSPYSEYLQKFIYEKLSLQEGGKFNEDFRITSWGKFLRKFWLDELPMIINWLKGDLKIVGVRPISLHYLSLYTDQLQKKRIKFKPGLVPPFYYDLPKSLEEIMASEEKYLDSYEKSPILTDIRYFFGSFINIFFRHARSR